MPTLSSYCLVEFIWPQFLSRFFLSVSLSLNRCLHFHLFFFFRPRFYSYCFSFLFINVRSLLLLFYVPSLFLSLLFVVLLLSLLLNSGGGPELSLQLVSESHSGPVLSVGFPPDVSDHFVSSSEDGSIRVWDLGDYSVKAR